MSRFNSPKLNKAGKRCTVCASPYHNRTYHTADERLTTRDVGDAPKVERKYHDKEQKS